MTTIVNKKEGFILIEVLVSIMILSIVGISLLKINSSQKKIYSIVTSKLDFLRYISIPLNQHSISLHNRKLNLYNLVKDRYNLKNDALIKELKSVEVEYTQKYKSIINIAQDETKIDILIDEITVKNRDGASKFLTVKK